MMVMAELAQSLRDDAFVQDPYPFYARAMSMGDLFVWQDMATVAAASHRSVSWLLRSKDWGREMPAALGPEPAVEIEPFARLDRCSMLELDPPRHTRLRKLVNRAFTSRNIANMEPEIESLTHQILDHLPQRTELQTEFCEQLPVRVIARLLGVADDMCPQMLSWSHDMVAMYQARRDQEVQRRACAAAQAFTQFITSEITRRRRQKSDDLMSQLVAVEDQEGGLSTDELVSTCILLLNAGHEATANSLGNGIKTILESGLDPVEILSPPQRTSTVEEILRFDPPLHVFERYARCDNELFGHNFRCGDKIALILASANRDPSVWEQADSFLPMRNATGHCSFGAGIHFCVGAPLARLELAIGLAAIFQRFPHISLASEPRYADRYHFHGLEELWVCLD